MSDMKNFLRDVGYFSVGAAAVILEAGGKAVKKLVCKGEETLRENQDTVDDIKRKAREAGEKIKEAAKDFTAKPEPTVEATPDAESPAEEIPVEEAPACEDAPVTPDVIYRTEEPVPAEEPIEEAAEEISPDAEDGSLPEDAVNG